ncbi:MAG: hypothetical protein AXA67_04610 [Methylothermaceae bacteria B42]|nr:MAG: hypothetical protein AXA67_04610 [Methylothermaceae bacteria B42]HHJ39968.1 MFS transporter [Methylothermaceae bacterium]
MNPSTVPYGRLSAFYFFYFATLGAFLPYWGLYLKGLGYSALEIGTVLALLSATKVVAPNILGWLADHSGRRITWIRWTCLLAAGLFLGIFEVHGYREMLLLTTAFGMFWSAALSQFEAVTLAHLGGNSRHYPWVRLWGSLGFIAAVLGLGFALERFAIGFLPQVLTVLLWLIWMVSLMVPEAKFRAHFTDSTPTWWPLLWRKEVIAFLLVVFLAQAAHGPYYVFYSIHLKALDYSGRWIGMLWTLGVVAEIVLFLLLPRLFHFLSPRALLLAGVGLGSVRWLAIGWYAHVFWVLLAAQVLHAATFAATHAAAMQLLPRYFGQAHQGKGQALYSSLSFGLGSMAGSYAAGMFWDQAGAPVVFAGAAVTCLLALSIALRWVWGYGALSQ